MSLHKTENKQPAKNQTQQDDLQKEENLNPGGGSPGEDDGPDRDKDRKSGINGREGM